MSNYSPLTNFSAKDALTTGDANKRTKGTEITAELNAISTAVNSKEDAANKNVNNGYCGLDSSALIPNARLQAAVVIATSLNVPLINTTSLTVGTGSGAQILALSGGVATRDFIFQTTGSSRWILRTTSTAEGGANAGSDFQLLRRDDTGAALQNSIVITRSTGAINFGDATSNPSHTFLGTGTVLFNGLMVQSGDVGSSPGLVVYNLSTSDGRSVISFRNDRTSAQNWNVGVDVSGGATKAFGIRNVTGATVPFTIATNDDVTLTGHILGPNGAAGTPSYSFSGSTNDGLFSTGAGNVSLSIAGSSRFSLSASALTISPQILTQDGSVSSPARSFSSDPDNGPYRIGANNWGLSAGGTKVADLKLISGSDAQVAFPAGTYTPSLSIAFSATAMTLLCGQSNVFFTTLTAVVTAINAPTNMSDGQTINWFLTQDGTGSRTMTWPTGFKWPSGTVGVLTTTANAVDLLVATFRNSVWYAQLIKDLK